MLIASSCGLLGVFLILRKMAMVGDAISHAVLPGIVIAYWVAGSRDAFPVLIGAAALGILTTVLIEVLYRNARLQTDASIGITFTWLFAIGIILISATDLGKVDLDQDCVLYGDIAYVPIYNIITESGVNLGPRSVWFMGMVTTLVLGMIILGYKGLKITTFDDQYAAALGITTGFWHYALMSAVSLTTVVAFESVGAILVVAFLIVPPATAYLLTRKLKTMLLLTVFIGFLASLTGYYLAVWLDGSIAGAMSVMAGVFFMLALLFSPTEGYFFKYRHSST